MRFLKYLSVQVVAYGLDLGAFVLLGVVVGAQPLVANFIGKVIAGGFAYIAHVNFTFEVANRFGGRERLMKYALLLAINVPLTTVVLGFVLLAGWGLVFSKLIADIACVAVTYWLSKTFIFSSDTDVAHDSVSGEIIE